MVEIVLVSDRGPYTFVRDGQGLHPVPRASSVTRLLDAAARRIEESVVWVSVSHFPADHEALRAGDFEGLAPRLGYQTRPVVFDEAEFAQYYREVGARQLWTALLDLWDEVPSMGQVVSGSFDAYQRVNQEIGRAASAECSPDSLVLVHDYQLIRVGRHLRDLRPTQWTALFLHTPFATPSSFTKLPEKVGKNIIDGMLAADLVGFQRRQWLERFMDCCRHLGIEIDPVGGAIVHDRGRTWTRCYPTPIEIDVVESFGRSNSVVCGTRTLRPKSAEHLVVRVDRVDPTKNIVRGFQAFDLLLREHPELHGRVHFLACLVPTRQEVEEYRRYEDQIRASVAMTVAAFPDSISVLWGENRATSMAALSVYDVLLVNPLSDGMNLVAQEGPAINSVHGCVVLSKTAGATDLLGKNVVPLHDPRNIEETKEALLLALGMPAEERKERAEAMRQLVSSRDPRRWLSEQISDLRLIRSGKAPTYGAY